MELQRKTERARTLLQISMDSNYGTSAYVDAFGCPGFLNVTLLDGADFVSKTVVIAYFRVVVSV